MNGFHGPNLVLPLELLVGAALVSALAVAMTVWIHHVRGSRRFNEQGQGEGLADAAATGLAVIEGGLIVHGNSAFRHLSGWREPSPVADFLSDLSTECAIEDLVDSIAPWELVLSGLNQTISVEVAGQMIVWHGAPRIALAVTDIRGRKSAEAQIHQLRSYDPLTGIANRSLFLLSLSKAISRLDVSEIAVLCFDLDRFKLINDMYGHAIGDELLIYVAKQAQDCAGDSLAARLGGDEFAIFVRGADAVAEASALASHLLYRLNQPITLRRHVVRVSASIGIALIGRETKDVETALRHADLALYRAKADGRGVHRLFEPGMDAIAHSSAQLEEELRLAIARGELFIEYEPLYGVQSRNVEGMAAHVGWQHPTRGLLLSSQFIPVAENGGLIVELGEWMLAEACGHAATWDPPCHLLVNVSPVQMAFTDVAEMTERVLRLTALQPARLELGFSERSLIGNRAHAVAMLDRIRALGATTVLSDFGTGCSYLSYFDELPFGKAKIERSFITVMLEDSHARSKVEALFSLARRLELPVLAEGVETRPQLEFLRQQGCAQAQGPLFGGEEVVEI